MITLIRASETIFLCDSCTFVSRSTISRFSLFFFLFAMATSFDSRKFFSGFEQFCNFIPLKHAVKPARLGSLNWMQLNSQVDEARKPVLFINPS